MGDDLSDLVPASFVLEIMNSGAGFWPGCPLLFDRVDRNFFGERLLGFSGRPAFAGRVSGAREGLLPGLENRV
jgi:hypothetical protein